MKPFLCVGKPASPSLKSNDTKDSLPQQGPVQQQARQTGTVPGPQQGQFDVHQQAATKPLLQVKQGIVTAHAECVVPNQQFCSEYVCCFVLPQMQHTQHTITGILKLHNSQLAHQLLYTIHAAG